MIYINGNLVTEETMPEIAAEHLKNFLITERLVIVNKNDEPILQQELSVLLLGNPKEIKLKAINSSILLRGFKEELHNYILKVELYIENTRENEDFSSMINSFIQVVEALIEFSSVEDFLQKEMVPQQQINDISKKAIEQAEVGNNEYILDLLEYELLPILHNFLNEINEVM